MKVQAQADGNLVIRYREGNWATTATANMQAFQSMKPTSTHDLSKWVYSSAAYSNLPTSDGKYSDVTSNVNPGTDDKDAPNDYALVKHFQIKAATADESARPNGLYVESIEVTLPDGTEPNQNLSSSLRVGIQCTVGSTTTRTIYGPVGEGENAPSDGYTVKIPGTPVDGVVPFTEDTVNLSHVGWNDTTKKANTEIVAASTPIPNVDGTPVEVYVYIWFEGEDAHLYSDNFSAESMSIAINFQSCSTKAASTTTSTT